VELEIKFKSIAERWFINVLLIVVCIITIAAVLLSAFLSSVYMERVKTLGNDYSYEFSSLKYTDSENFQDVAISLSDEFAYKDKIEVQVVDKTDKVVVSTSGFLSQEKAKMPDYFEAKSSKKGVGIFKGKNESGERVYALSTAVYDINGKYLGAYRWITSLKGVYRQITITIMFIVAFSILALSVCIVSGRFFIKSIVKPIRDVSNIARKIAMGDFKNRIEPNRNDEIGELCDTINYMATELSQAETMKNDFISSVSHELRTPLTAIKGWGETAKMSLDTDPELVSRGLDVVLSEAERLSNLVEELLDFSRMQSGRLTVNARNMNVSQYLAEAADMYTELARKQGVEVSFQAPPKDSFVFGDPDRLKQVFINIIDNAVKYTEKGGLVLVTQNEEEGCVKIVVKDTGVGIPAQDIDRVKEKFFKSNKTVRGSGIGLAVADEIIKQHNGLLFLESSEGVGTTVTVVLPIIELPEETSQETEEVILKTEDKIDSVLDMEAEETVLDEIIISEDEDNG